MIGAVCIIQWNNPYTKPPEGMPVVLAEFFYDANDPRCWETPEEVREFFHRYRLLGSGYSIYWQAVSEPPVEVSQETLARRRKKRLWRRMEQKYPLFAEQFFEEEIKRKQDYYSGITDAEIEQKRANVLEKERERLKRLLEERVVIYWEGTKDSHDD